MNWQKLPLGFLIEKGHLRRTAWAVKIGSLRFVEWPWIGFEVRWNKKSYRKEYK